MAEKSITPAVKQQAAPPAHSESVQAGAQFDSLLALQKSAGNRAVSQLLSQSPGQPLDAETRRWMEQRFQADLSAVRVHTSADAAEMARSLGAMAFTHNQHVVFSAGRYAPSTPTGKLLLAHELSHTLQNRLGIGRAGLPLLSSPGSPAEVEAEMAASTLLSNAKGPAIQAAPSAVVQLSPEKDLVKKHTNWNFLNEKNLGAELLLLALQGNYEITLKVMDYLGSTDRDDVAEGFVTPATNEQLEQLVKTNQGRQVLDRIYDELTSGNVDSAEQKQADRIIEVKTGQISPEDFLKGKENAKIFPYRKPGLTVLNDAPITAELRGKGKVYVKIPVRVFGYDKYRQDTKTLPTAVFTSGIELPENEIVGVRLYDEGGKVVHYPALYLVQMGNKSTADTLKTMGEVTALGLTFGSGALIGGGAKAATWGARASVYAERAFTVLGAVTSVINDHRGWFIERFGERGKEFVETMDTVNSVVAIYGFTRVVFGMGKLVNGLRKSYQNWRRAAKDVEKSLDNVEAKRIQQVDSETQNFLKQVEQAEEAQKAERAVEVAGKSQAPASGAPKSPPAAEATAPKLTEKPKVEAPAKPAETVKPKPAQEVKAPKDKVEAAKEAGQKPPADVIDIRTGKPRTAPTESAAASKTAQVAESVEESEGVTSLEKFRQKRSAAQKKKVVKREATTGRPVEEEVEEVIEGSESVKAIKKGEEGGGRHLKLVEREKTSSSKIDQGGVKSAKPKDEKIPVQKIKQPTKQIKTLTGIPHSMNAGAPLDSELLVRARDARISLAGLEKQDFFKNVAVAKVVITGEKEARYITKVNSPKFLHSEEHIISEVQELRKKFGLSNVRIVQLYSERKPCATCWPQLKKYNAELFYSISDDSRYVISDGKAERLMSAYGL